MYNRLIKNFCFHEDKRTTLTFSDTAKVRLNTESKLEQKIMLKADGNGWYSLDSDIFVETELIECNGNRGWLGFEAIYKSEPGTLDLPASTSLGFKVKTTAGNYWWDGSAWAVAGASDWNTELEISANLPTFPIGTVGNRKIGFVVNLVTTDRLVTPEVYELKLLGNFEFDTFSDLIYDTVIRLLNTNFRSTSLLVFQNGSTSISAIDLASVLKNKGYNVYGIRSVYDLTNDPLKLQNLFVSYTQGSVKRDAFTFEHGQITTSSIPADALVEVTFEYLPTISVRTNQDYYEVPSYPHICFTKIAQVTKKAWVMSDTNCQGVDFIRDKVNGVAVQQYSPAQKSYRFEYGVYTGGQEDQDRLLSDLKGFFSRTSKLVSWALGITYDMVLVDEIDTSGNQDNADSSDTNLSFGSFDVLGVLSYDKPSLDVPLVLNVSVSMSVQ